MTNLIQGREMEFGEAIRPLFELLPPVEKFEWHRFSFDVVQLTNGLQVVHIRFMPIT